MPKLIDTFRIESARLKDWDYSIPRWYYITINSKNHLHCFGTINNYQMHLNLLGAKAEHYWKDIPKHYSNAELDYFIVMPNHIHGIIIIDHTVKVMHADTPAEILKQNEVKTRHAASLQKNITLSNIVGSFKSAVAKFAHDNGYHNFSWQSRFYDRIIRNETELFKIRNYIEQNPVKWEIEKNDPENIDII